MLGLYKDHNPRLRFRYRRATSGEISVDWRGSASHLPHVHRSSFEMRRTVPVPTRDASNKLTSGRF
jgi:hypothetical protein